MANKKTLKGYFETGDIPNQSQYHELINSNLNLNETGTQILVGTLSSSFLEVENHITSSGNISSSGIITAEHILSSDDIVAQGIISASGALHGNSITIDGNIYIKSVGFVEVGGVSQILFQSQQTYFQNDIKLPNNKELVLGTDSNYKIGADSINRLLITSGSSTSQTTLITYSPHNKTLNFNGDAITTNGYLKATNITASGNISASGTIYADNFQSTGGDVAGINFTDNLLITGDITASGDISASGVITQANGLVAGEGRLYFSEWGGSNIHLKKAGNNLALTNGGLTTSQITASGTISSLDMRVGADGVPNGQIRFGVPGVKSFPQFIQSEANQLKLERGNGETLVKYNFNQHSDGPKVVVTGNISGSGNLKVDGSQVDFTNLPTSDPSVAGRLYRDGTDLKISLG